MAKLIDVPFDRVPQESLQALLEEFASRDGTDYGERETALTDRVDYLAQRLRSRALSLLFDLDSETWDLLPKDEAQALLAKEQPEDVE